MLSDLVFATIPIYFIWSLHRPVMERILISILMAFGMLAAMAEACIIYHTHVWSPRKSSTRDWMPLYWWYRVEEIGLIVAACTPFLKPLVERILSRFGASRFSFVTMQLNTIRPDEGAAPEGVAKMGFLKQSRNGDQNLIKQNSGQASNRASSDRFDRASDGMKLQREEDCAEV
jgi:hypothetical protein